MIDDSCVDEIAVIDLDADDDDDDVVICHEDDGGEESIQVCQLLVKTPLKHLVKYLLKMNFSDNLFK